MQNLFQGDTMKHTIEINTVDALLIVQLLHENHFENVVDKAIAERLRNEIIEAVGKELYESVNKELPNAIDKEISYLKNK